MLCLKINKNVNNIEKFTSMEMIFMSVLKRKMIIEEKQADIKGLETQQLRIVIDWIKTNLKPRKTINYNTPVSKIRKYFEREKFGFSISDTEFKTVLEIMDFEIINNKDCIFTNVSETSKGIKKNNFDKFTEGYWNRYNERCRINVSREVKEYIYEEAYLFKKLVSILCTLDDRALRNDPQRYYSGIGRNEGGITFKDCAIVFRTWHIDIKTTIIPLEQNNPIYPLIVANTINNLCFEFTQTIGNSVKDRLMKATSRILNNEEKFKILLNDLNKLGYTDNWNNFYKLKIKLMYCNT